LKFGNPDNLFELLSRKTAAESSGVAGEFRCQSPHRPQISKNFWAMQLGSTFRFCEMRFFLTNFLVTLIAYGLTSFVYPSQSMIVPRICLIWAAPLAGTLAGLVLIRVLPLGSAFAAEALAIYIVTGTYCVVYHEKAPIDTLQYVTFSYFLPGALIALVVGSFANWSLRNFKRLGKR
jgi:hypothetical protein